MLIPLAAQALYRSLEELAVCGQIPLELLPAIIHQYDLVLFNLVQSRCRDEVSFSGRVKTFRLQKTIVIIIHIRIFTSSLLGFYRTCSGGCSLTLHSTRSLSKDPRAEGELGWENLTM